MTERSWFSRAWARLRSSHLAPLSGGGSAVDRGRGRLAVLLLLFDALLIAAVLLSFQATDLVEQEHTLLATRTYYEVLYQTQVITQTEVITHLLPYGSVP